MAPTNDPIKLSTDGELDHKTPRTTMVKRIIGILFRPNRFGSRRLIDPAHILTTPGGVSFMSTNGLLRVLDILDEFRFANDIYSRRFI